MRFEGVAIQSAKYDHADAGKATPSWQGHAQLACEAVNKQGIASGT